MASPVLQVNLMYKFLPAIAHLTPCSLANLLDLHKRFRKNMVIIYIVKLTTIYIPNFGLKNIGTVIKLFNSGLESIASSIDGD